MKNILYAFAGLFIVSCSSSPSTPAHLVSGGQPQSSSSKLFNSYWYSGEAEITSYALSQSRYGEVREGTAVLVFVTEPFSQSKQVKLDDWRDPTDDNVSVMKLNMTKKFITGIYPYSMMMSTFTPVSAYQHPALFKVTTTSQEWCGHTFIQLNLAEDSYRLRGFSYFESEGDIDVNLDKVLTEDELWSRIRLDAASLPQGEKEILPATFHLRLNHEVARPKQAILTLSEVETSAFSDHAHKKYEVVYDNRSLAIYFEATVPNEILGWEETYHRSAGAPSVTSARRIKTITSPYWQKNHTADTVLRAELGLD